MGSWSPDGAKIVFWTMFKDNGIYVINSDGSNLKRLTFPRKGYYDDRPDWSPDGTKIVFNSGKGGDDNWADWDIYVMDSDGGNIKKLTDNPAQDFSPCWSPDGSKIAFVSRRDNPNSDIYVMNVDGSNQKRITNGQEPVYDTPSWSPDGKLMAFRRVVGGENQIHIVGADGRIGEKNISDGNGTYMYPSWSPDGTKMAFTLHNDSLWQIYIMNANGKNEIKLTDGPGDENPRWFDPAFASIAVTPLNKALSTWAKIKSETR
jgi:Tol biopolymer transport system component